jgi:hypothetical protein
MVPVLANIEVIPIDVPAIFGITLGMLVILIPVLGVTIRYAVKPVLEALQRSGVIGAAQTAAAPAVEKNVELLSRRLLELEQEVAKLKGQAPRHLVIDPLAVNGASVEERARVR